MLFTYLSNLSLSKEQIDWHRPPPQGETTVRGCDCQQPTWEEQLCFADLYPPLYQRVRLQLLRGGQPLAEHSLRLDDVCRDTPPRSAPLAASILN